MFKSPQIPVIAGKNTIVVPADEPFLKEAVKYLDYMAPRPA
jgi:hypothetical protein